MRIANQNRRRGVILLAGLLGFGEAQGALSYWDSDGATPGSGPGTMPGGTWGVDSFWSSSAAGDVATSAWTGGDTAVFSAGADATGAFTVTLVGTQAIGGMSFQEGAVTLAGGSLDLMQSSATIDLAAGLTGTINTSIGGSGGLVKTGPGILSHNAISSYSGATMVNAGTLALAGGSLATNGLNVTGASAAVTHSAGSVTSAGSLMIANATAGAYTLSGGTLNTSSTIAGQVGGNGLFTQTGGTHTTTAVYLGFFGIPVGSIGTYNLSSGSLTTFDMTLGTLAADKGTFTQTGGDVTVNGLLDIKSATSRYTISGGSASAAWVTVGGTLSINAGGTFAGGTAGTTINSGATLNIGGTFVTGGTLRVRTGGSLSVTAGGKVDLTDEHAIAHGTAAGGVGSWNGSVYTGMTGLVASGRNSNPAPGLWDGEGIVTSQSQATSGNFHGIGIARASDVRPETSTSTATWAGQSITGTDTLVMYTYGGDANLDGKLNIDDYVRIDQGIAGSLTGWSNGDFNYDGKVNIDDYTTVIDSNIGSQGGFVFPTAGSTQVQSVVTVPEISISGMALLTSALAASARHRRRAIP